MEDILKPVQTVRKVQNNIEKFESLSLKEVSSSRKENQLSKSDTSTPKPSILEVDDAKDHILQPQSSTNKTKGQHADIEPIQTLYSGKHRHQDSLAFHNRTYLEKSAPSSLSDNAREILRSQPSQEDLLAVLQYLQFGIQGRHEFNIRTTSSKSAQIINVLVTITIPDVWTNIKQKELSEDEALIKKAIVSSLSSIAGLGALLAQAKQFSSDPHTSDVLCDTVMVLGEILKGSKVIDNLLNDAYQLYDKEATRRMYWQEVTALVAGSRVLSVTAQAFTLNETVRNTLDGYGWLSSGAEYSKWLAKNITTIAVKQNVLEESWKYLSQIIKRGMGLGHRDTFVAEIYSGLLLGKRALWTPLHLILKHLTPHEQKAFFNSILSHMAQEYFASTGLDTVALSYDPASQKVVTGAAALVAGIVKNNQILEDYVEEWLTSTKTSHTSIGLSLRRTLIATLGHSEDKLRRVLEKSLVTFGDKVQIQHASIIQQEATTQTILLAVGYLNRIDVKMLRSPSIGTFVMRAVSNRLSASMPKARFLGMIVGTAISRLVDTKDNVVDFGVEEMESDDAKAWLEISSLNDCSDDDINMLSSLSAGHTNVHKPTPLRSIITATKKKALPQTSKIKSIEEVTDTSESEDDLVPYEKPESDPEDSEEDPTLINRNKPSAPVYIVDLIKQLQTPDKPDIVSLALKTAPSLIRRKAGFGTELSENVNTLVTILVNLQDAISEDELQQMQLESLIACIVAKPNVVGPSMADLYFRGDFSISQRIMLLTATGLAARELSGFQDDRTIPSEDNFPSKRLPVHLQPQSAPPISATRNPVAMLTDTAAHEAIRPMALAAADKVTGPSVLKIRTFSSRMEVEKKAKEKTMARTKIIPKNLHKILTEAIYLPLCCRMSLLLSHTIGGRLPNTTILHSSTMRLFLQTLTLVLHTLGPSSSLHLPALTHETLLLLLNLHSTSHVSTDPAVLPALLHLMLALMDVTIEAGVTAQERLISDYGAQVTELVTWSNSLGDKVSVPDVEADEGGMSWSILAAGIQVKWYEMARKFQGRILGLTIDEMDQLGEN